MKLILLFLVGLALLTSTASADTFVDSFNRADSIGDLGDNFTETSVWGINNSKARVIGGAGVANLVNVSTDIINVSAVLTDADGNFSDGDNRFGFMFYIQNSSNTTTDGRYVVLFKPLYGQIILYKDGWTQIGATATSKTITQNDVLKIKVDTVGTGLEIYKNDTLFHTFSAWDNTYTDGYCGMYGNAVPAGQEVFYDNFTVEYTPVSGNPVISGISNQTANATVGYIDFTTDVNCNSTIVFSTNADMSSSKWLNASADWPSNDSTTHTIKIIKLNGSTQYYYQIWAWNTSDNSKVSNSSTQTYTTAAGQTWINVSTSESIQHAVDNLYPHGTANLSAGNHNITVPIWITANNVTLAGQGKSVTTINQTTVAENATIISAFYDWNGRYWYMYNAGIKWGTLVTRLNNYPDEVVSNVTISDLTINIYDTKVSRFGAIQAIELKNFTVDNVEIQSTASNNKPYGIFISHFVDAMVSDCLVNGAGEGITLHGGSYRGNVKNTTVSNTFMWTVIQLNGVSGYEGTDCQILNNTLFDNVGSLYVYSSLNVTVDGNTVHNTTCQYGGIFISLYTGRINVSNNVVKDSSITTAGFGGISYYQKLTGTYAAGYIYNNLIFNVTGHGLGIVQDDAVYTNMIEYVYSNTISNNSLSGIYNPDDQPLTYVKNNIITNNDGSGLYNITNNSYNCVWNNGNNYNNSTPGTGNISVNPLFASATDFHLKSQYGRWTGATWTTDGVSSPCIDAGDPASDYSNEPSPNGGRINMGAYGDTDEASKSSTGAPASSTIIIPANSLGMFNNWTTTATFSAIAANESNDICYSYYNVSTGEWESYYVGYSWNANNVIERDNSVIGFFDAETTISPSNITPSSTQLYPGWNMLAVQGTDNETISDIIADIGINCTDVWAFSTSTGTYTNTTSYSVQNNQGFLADINRSMTWTRSDL